MLNESSGKINTLTYDFRQATPTILQTFSKGLALVKAVVTKARGNAF